MVDWLAGNRVRGTSTERTSTTGFNDVAAISGGWKEVGRTTLGSAGDTIDVTSLPNKRYYMILTHSKGSGSPDVTARINSDTSTNYSSRWMDNGSGENSGVSRTSMLYDSVGGGFNHKFNVGYIANLASKEKLNINHSVDSNTTSAGTAPARSETVSKWVNTSDALSAFSLISSVNMDSGSEVVVLGWDETDTHTTNFWEELASVELSSSNTTIDTGTITAKKYLMYQIFAKKSTSGEVRFQFNSDTGSNYAQRNSINGTDYAYTSLDKMNISGDPAQTTDNFFGSGFIINNSSNEKLLTGHGVWSNTAGAGTAPKRAEVANKWANTSSQITSIQAVNTTFLAGSILKVWGSN